jgi:hypothetical protein
MKSTYLLMILCMALALTSCISRDTAPGAGGPDVDFFPPSDFIAGWAKSPEGIRSFDGASLYDYIDGEADLIRRYDFRKLRTLRYEFAGAPPGKPAETGRKSPENQEGNRTAVIIDAYELGSPLDAFGLYGSYRPSGAETLRIGAEGFFLEGFLAFHKGNYFVKAFADGGNSASCAPMLRHFARALASRIPGDERLPPELSCFPEEGLLRGTMIYSPVSPIGFDFMPGSLEARYRWGKSVSTVLLIFCKDDSHAREILRKYRGRLAGAGNPCELEERAEDAVLDGVDSDRGAVHFISRGSTIVGALGIHNRRKALRTLEACLGRASRLQRK